MVSELDMKVSMQLQKLRERPLKEQWESPECQEKCAQVSGYYLKEKKNDKRKEKECLHFKNSELIKEGKLSITLQATGLREGY